jgi:formate--tetrahydrofolate ligase
MRDNGVMTTDLEIARAARTSPITDIAAGVGLDTEDLVPYGWSIAKVSLDALRRAGQRRGQGRLVLVTAMSPTPPGEGKTTTSIGLADALT